MYHGTTRLAADAIAHTGFDELDGWAIAQDVASRFDIAVEVLRTSLSAAHPIERTGDPFIWVTTNRIKAMRWANRAPEAELWLLEAAYALLYPEDSTQGMGLAESLP
ncbi:MAG: hypothetical protein QOH28_3695, partial [Actinomycetota bacterium]|nr:hypothetical protein [Actinomycetota bacterium]